MAKQASTQKERFSPTKGTRLGQVIKKGANQINDTQREFLDTVVDNLMGKTAHGKVSAHRR